MIRVLLGFVEKLMHASIAECTVLRVTDVADLTPHMRRIRFAADGVAPFATDENLHVKLLLPPSGASRDRWLREQGSGRARLRGRGLKPEIRKYTLRRIDAMSGRLEIDFVLHADGGPGAAWAEKARAGDVLGMIGPGGRGIGPGDWRLIAGDETALPAIGRILESLSHDAEGQVLIEVDGPAEEQSLTRPAAMSLRWLHRNGAPPGTTRLLPDAIAAAALPVDGRRVFVWAAGEFEAIQAIRTHLRRERGLGKHQNLAVAYWRRGSAA